jgi:uncharacterized protein YecE (DUF72 family)
VEVYVGTSGWVYDWNLGGDLEWYVRFSGLNAVELNASFYRFPFKNQVLGWSRRGSSLRWSIKVHRSITHIYRFNEKALNIWFRFKELFEPLDKYISFYLFQLPPNFICSKESLTKIEKFYETTRLKERFAIEFRNESCFNNEVLSWGRQLGLTIVSVDSPQTTWIVNSNGNVYLRIHGRLEWYNYNYSVDELKKLTNSIIKLKPQRTYIFFNNDHWMLENARIMLKLLTNLLSDNT